MTARPTRWSAPAAVAFALLASRSFAQCPGEGDCREPHETPGCVMPDCCALVCEVNPLCCEFGWDEGCVELALELCDGINCPAEGPCLEAHPSPGCDDYDCCDLVSTLDGWCSGASWDAFCAHEAQALCGLSPCEVEAAGAVDEDEPCYERLNDGWGVGTPATRIAIGCGDTLAGRAVGGAPRDGEWFALDGATRRRFRVDLEHAFPAQLQLLLGEEEGPNETHWLVAFDPCGGTRSVSFIVEGGVSTLILSPGNRDRAIRGGLDCPESDPDNPPDPEDPLPEQRFGLGWRLALECVELADIDADGKVNAQDLAMVLGAWGTVDRTQPVDPRFPIADLDGDGKVDAQDLAQVLSAWDDSGT